MPGDLRAALDLIDAAHAKDPTKITFKGEEVPYELHYARKCTNYLERRQAKLSEADSKASTTDALQLAVRAQHLRRWEVPRSDYPMTKPGYFKWRTYLKQRQADLAATICRDCGYDEATCERVAALIRKEDLRADAETQALEDVACLVFLDDQFEKFSDEHDDEKIIGILRKTWTKMAEPGRAMALEMNMDEGRPKQLLEKALSG